jgi:DNA-binding MarR family transcriptional regulator
VGEALDLESSTLTPLLKRLETQGLVARARDPEDERRVIVTLTEAGAALRDKAKAVPEQLFCKLNMPLDALGDLRERLKGLAV